MRTFGIWGRGALVAGVLGLGVACGGSNSPTTPSTPTPSGPTQLVSEDLTVGTGATAATGRLVTVDYTGWLYDESKADKKGTQFDSTLNGQPYSFFLGISQVITGWQTGIVGMKVGGTRRLTIPPDQGYGAGGYPPAIPGNATLIFEITLLAVQ